MTCCNAFHQCCLTVILTLLLGAQDDGLGFGRLKGRGDKSLLSTAAGIGRLSSNKGTFFYMGAGWLATYGDGYAGTIPRGYAEYRGRSKG